MIVEFVLFIGICCFNVLVTSMVKPLEDLKKQAGIHCTDEPNNYIKIFLRDLLSCEYCFGFWVGLIMYESIFIAALISLSSHVIKQLINKL